MANPHKGEVALEAGERTYTLRLSINAIAEIEDLLDTGFGELVSRLGAGEQFRLGTLRVVLWGGLRKHHKGLSLDDAGEIIGEAGIAATTEAISKAIALGFPEFAAGSENPQTASPAEAGPTSS
jgi:hypothetical protein